MDQSNEQTGLRDAVVGVVLLGPKILLLLLLLLSPQQWTAAFFGEAAPTAEAVAQATPEAQATEEIAEPTAAPTEEPTAEPEAVSDESDSLTGIVWRWTGFADPAGANDITVSNPEDYLLVLSPDGTFNVKADCNVGGGAYTSNDGSLTLEPGPLTRALCPPDSLSDQYLRLLSNVAGYTFDEEGNLVLNLAADGGDMTFANGGPAAIEEAAAPSEQPAAIEASLVGRTFLWPGFTDAGGNAVTVDNPENYSLTLLPDGTFSLKADCNVGGGSYTYAEDGALQVDLGALTAAACPPDSLSDEFLAFVAGVNSAAIDEDGSLVLTTADGSTSTLITGRPVAKVGDGTPEEPVGVVWQWAGFTDPSGSNDLSVPNPENYLLTLWPDGTMNFKADCNVGSGAYTLEGESLTLVPGLMTLAACPADSLGDRFVQHLADVATYTFDENGNLVLNLVADGGDMVFINGGPAEVDEAAAPEDQTAAAGAGLTGVTFLWPGFTDAEGNAVTVNNPEDYTLTLLPDGTFTVKADCNVGSGTYTYGEDGSLQLDLGPLTRAFCPPGSQSDAFLAFLAGVNGATIDENGAVTLTTADGGASTLVAGEPAGGAAGKPAPAEGLVGVVWQWTRFDDTAGVNDLTVSNPEDYLLVLWPDGTFNIKADCNVGSGAYTADEAGLTLNLGPLTRAACPPESLGDRYVQLLGYVRTYVFDDEGNLVLNLFADAGNMVFANGGPAEPPTEAAEPAEEQTAAVAGGLTGITLVWFSYTDASGSSTPVDNPEDYSLALLPDGVFFVKADCNVGGGIYTYNEDGTITLTLNRLTRALCPPESQSNQFLEFLAGINSITLDDAGNVVAALSDGATVTFNNAGPVETPVGGAAIAPLASADDLVNILWLWQSYDDPTGENSLIVDDPTLYNLVFLPDGTYTFKADCNVGSGAYTIEDDGLMLLPGPMTLAACPPGSLSDAYLALLLNTSSAGFNESGDLVLNLIDGGTLIFANAGPAETQGTGGPVSEAADPLSGTSWQWINFRDAKQDYNVSTPANYVIEFLPGGQVGVQADCNRGSGSYTAEESSLNISILVTTLAACPEGSLGGVFIEYLNQSALYTIEGDVLRIDLVADGGTMTFNRIRQ